jgi:hypothetical protein
LCSDYSRLFGKIANKVFSVEAVEADDGGGEPDGKAAGIK